MAPATATQGRSWCFTAQRSVCGESWASWAAGGLPAPAYHRYMVYQAERGEENGAEHLQGYVAFTKPVRMSACLKWLPKAHFEVARGSAAANFAYCGKADTKLAGPFEFGKRPADAPQDDHVADFVQRIQGGALPVTLAASHPGTFLRFYSGGEKLASAWEAQQLRGPVEVVVIVGPSGSGKSHWAHTRWPDAYSRPADGRWDGYERHPVVIWDDPDTSRFDVCGFLQQTDKWRVQVNVKYGHRWLLFQTMVVTSNIEPEQWCNSERWPAVKRRIKVGRKQTLASPIVWDGASPLCSQAHVSPASAAEHVPASSSGSAGHAPPSFSATSVQVQVQCSDGGDCAQHDGDSGGTGVVGSD